jgi:hypothetical protein
MSLPYVNKTKQQGKPVTKSTLRHNKKDKRKKAHRTTGTTKSVPLEVN